MRLPGALLLAVTLASPAQAQPVDTVSFKDLLDRCRAVAEGAPSLDTSGLTLVQPEEGWDMGPGWLTWQRPDTPYFLYFSDEKRACIVLAAPAPEMSRTARDALMDVFEAESDRLQAAGTHEPMTFQDIGKGRRLGFERRKRSQDDCPPQAMMAMESDHTFAMFLSGPGPVCGEMATQ